MDNDDFCIIIKFSSWLWDFLSDIMGCNCKNQNYK